MKFRRLLAFELLFILLLTGLGPASATAQQAPEPILISANPTGDPGNGWSALPAISENGRVIAFVSTAADLVPGDTNGKADIFIHDRLEGLTRRASVNSQGLEANGWSYRFALSGDGRLVAFASVADNLAPDDHNGNADIFIHDRLTGRTDLVSRSTRRGSANGWSDWPAISRDGRFISFSSAASDLIYGDRNNQVDTFLHDRLTGQTRRVSVDSAGVAGTGPSGWASAISGNGAWVAFTSMASFDPQDSNGKPDVYLHNRVSFETVYLPTPWSDRRGYQGSDAPKLSYDGTYLTVSAEKSEPGDQSATALFVYKLTLNGGQRTAELIASKTGEGSDLLAVLSPDGTLLGSRWVSPIRAGTQTNKIQVEGLRGDRAEMIAMEIRRDNLGTGQIDPPALSEGASHIAFSMLTDAPSGGGMASQIYLYAPDGDELPEFFLGGQVTDKSGAPLRNAKVYLADGREVRSGPRGYFFFSGLAAGRYSVAVEKEGFQFEPESYQVQVASDRRDLVFKGSSADLLAEARKDIGMPYSFYRGCESDLTGCDGPYHGFHAGYCTDLVLDAYKFGVDFNIQWALERDALAHPDHFYRWRNARNSQDLWRYFHYTGQLLPNNAPYLPGDILFFDWDDDSVMDHVALVSEVGPTGLPFRMVDATGKIDYNPSGLAAELAWERFHHDTVRGHGRWQGSYGATVHNTPEDLYALHVAIDSTHIQGQVLAAGSGRLTGVSGIEAARENPARPLRGGNVAELDNGIVFSLISPDQNGALYQVELTAHRPTVYYLHLQLTRGGVPIQYQGSARQRLGAGETHTFLIHLSEKSGALAFETQ